jgi:hypothetical protein
MIIGIGAGYIRIQTTGQISQVPQRTRPYPDALRHPELYLAEAGTPRAEHGERLMLFGQF